MSIHITCIMNCVSQDAVRGEHLSYVLALLQHEEEKQERNITKADLIANRNPG